MKKALVTGALGQDGSYMIEYLVSLGYRVYGLIRKAPVANSHLVEFLKRTVNQCEFIYGDVRDELSLRSAIQKSWPDEIYNLAGQVFVPLSWQMPEETFDVNVGGLARILKIVEHVKNDTKVYQASTSEMFGNHPGQCDHETPMAPTSPYGISKLAAHKLAQLYRTRGIYTVCGVLFNHESPRRGHEMVTMKIASTVAGWANGSSETLFLGNLDSRRDWGFAGDYVKAMHAMMQQKEPGDYVVGTGISHSVQDFLDTACRLAGIDKRWQAEHTVVDQRLTRVQEIYDMRADNSKVRAMCGWQPDVDFEALVRMMVESQKRRSRKGD
jgi:GDPmannose 4,6-dehydratase